MSLEEVMWFVGRKVFSLILLVAFVLGLALLVIFLVGVIVFGLFQFLVIILVSMFAFYVLRYMGIREEYALILTVLILVLGLWVVGVRLVMLP